MTELIFTWLGYACFSAGAFFVLTGAVGIIRFPDFFTRTHAASMTDSIGLPLILLGLVFYFPFGIISFKLLLLIIFALVTSSTASHALAKAALTSGLNPIEHDDKEEKTS